MSYRLHLTPQGPRPCRADLDRPNSPGCRYQDGGHYGTVEEAESAFAERMGGAVPAAQRAGAAESYSAEELRSAIQHFTVANDLTDPEARALAHRLRTASEHSGESEMYRGMTGYGGISGVSWSELQAGSRLSMQPRSWTDSEQVADEFSWDQSADEDDPAIKSVIIVAESGIEGVHVREDSTFEWQNEMVSTAGTFVVDRIEDRDGGELIEDSEGLEGAESIAIYGHWETDELDDDQWEDALKPHGQEYY